MQHPPQSMNKSTCDFITELPYEILPLILTSMTIQELTTMITVSKLWQSRILNCGAAWSAIVISQTTFATILPYLPSIGPHVLKAKLFGLLSDHYDPLFAHMINGCFTKLRILEIKGPEFPSKKEEQFVAALGHVKETLKEFRIHLATLNAASPVPFHRVLSQCENLITFHYVENSAISPPQTHVDKCLAKVCRPNLIDLRLCVKSLDLSTLKTVLGSCPNVQTLELHGCPAGAHSIACKLCPNLVSFSEDSYYSRRGTKVLVSRNSADTSLSYIHASVDDLDDLEKIVSTSRIDTLKTMNLMMGTVTQFSLHRSSKLMSTTFDHLRHLSLYYSNPYIVEPFVIDLLRRVPLMDHFSLFDCDIVTRNLINALKEYNKLSFLHMDNLVDFEDQDGFVDLLRGYSSSLKVIRLYGCGFDLDATLDTLAGVDTLRRIDMSGCVVTAEALDGFFERLARQGSLMDEVGLQAQDEVTDATLHHISELKHLTSLSLSYLSNITNDGVQLLYRNRQITKQHIFGCDQLTI